MSEELKEEVVEEVEEKKKGVFGKVKDAIIDDIKDAAIESVVGGMGGSLGAPDLATPNTDAVAVPSAGLGIANF